MPKTRLSVFIASMAGGGAERVTSILLPIFCEHFETHLVLLEDRSVYPIPTAVKVTLLGKNQTEDPGMSKFLRLLPLAKAYGAFCHQRQIDTSFSLLNRSNYINVLSRRFGNPARIVISERGMPSGAYPDLTPRDIISRVLVRHLYPQADLVIPNSYGVRHDLEAHFGVRAPMVTLNNPIDLEAVDRQLELASAPLEEAPGTFHILNVGRLTEAKHQVALIRALARLHDPTVHLHILGDGELHDMLLEEARQAHVTHQVTFHGFQKNPFSFMRQADAFVLSSLHEGFPNALVEALACGLPCVSTDCMGGARQVLAPDSDLSSTLRFGMELTPYGILVPPRDLQALTEALGRLRRDEALRRSLRTRARARAEQLAVGVMAPQFLKVLERPSR